MSAEETKYNAEETLHSLLSDEESEDEPDKLTIVPFKTTLNEQNSFIDVIINSFFYKKEIMKSFETEDPPMEENYRLIYELHSIFEQMKKLTSPVYFKKTPKLRRFVDCTFLKHELKYQFKGKYFNPKESGNASDLLSIIYNALHVYYNEEDNVISLQQNKCINKNCLVHELAYLDIASQIYCSICNKKGTLYKYPIDTYYYAIDTNKILTKLYQNNLKKEDDLCFNKLFELEKLVHDETFMDNENENFICDCRKVNKFNFKNNLIMLKSHKYFTVSLLWKEPPKFEDICRIFITFPQFCKNTDLFHVYNDFEVKEYILQGLIVMNTNDQKHISFFINDDYKTSEFYEKLEWLFCNENETKVMSSYKEVIEWCLFNDFHPILLFYMYSNTDKILEPKNIEFTKEDLEKYMHHCTLVDKINGLTYTNIKLKKETLKPTLKDVFTSYDDELYKKVNEIKNDETKGKKYNYMEELEEEKEKEALEEIKEKEEEEEVEKEEILPKTLKRPQNLEKLNKSKNDFIFKKGIKNETFRNYPYKREGNWVCSNCDNINNPSTFECVKCKFIDMGIFAKIEEEKNNNMNKTGEEKGKKKARTYRNKSGNKRKNEFDQFNKKCLNCGNSYINKCVRCQNVDTNSKGTFSQIRDEKDLDIVKYVYNRASTIIKNKNKNKEKNPLLKEWICKNCKKANIGKKQFCEKYKFNKY